MSFIYKITLCQVELGGGVFPFEGTSETPMEGALQAVYNDAESKAYAWLDSRAE